MFVKNRKKRECRRCLRTAVLSAAASPLVYALRGDAILLLYALAFTLYTVARLERSCAENLWTCAVAGLRVGDRWRPSARAADRCYASGQEHRRVNDLPLRRQDGSGRDLSAGRVERDQ